MQSSDIIALRSGAGNALGVRMGRRSAVPEFRVQGLIY